MATRMEREKKERLNEHYKQILAKLLSKEENKFCADCLAKGPRWVSWNLGVLLCIRCSGIHRSLGVHISKVKSVNLDTWTGDQVVKMCSRGNGWAKEKYEAHLPKDFKRPQGDSSMEYFIRDKYEKLKYCSSKEVVLRSIEEYNIFQETESPRRRDRRKDMSNGVASNTIKIDKPAASVPRPKSQHLSTTPTKPQPTMQVANGNVEPPKSSMDDLLGLSSPVASNPTTSDTFQSQPPPSADLTFDLFTSMQSGVTPTTCAPAESASPVEQSASAEKKPMSKDSILSLYGQNQPIQPNPYAAPGSYPIAGQAFQQQPVTMATSNMGFQGGYNMPQMAIPQQNVIGFPQHQQNVQAMQQFQWQQQQQQQQQQQLQQQMQAMQLSGVRSNTSLNTGMRSYSSMPQMSPPQQSNYNLSGGAMLGVPLQQSNLASSQPSLVGLDPTIGGWGGGAINSGQTLSTQLWK